MLILGLMHHWMNSNLFVLSVCAYRNMCIYKVEYGKFYFLDLLTLCMLGIFSCFCCFQLIFFEIIFFIKLIWKHYQSVKQFGSRRRPSVGPHLDSNCLCWLLQDDKSHCLQGKG